MTNGLHLPNVSFLDASHMRTVSELDSEYFAAADMPLNVTLTTKQESFFKYFQESHSFSREVSVLFHLANARSSLKRRVPTI